MSKTTNMLRFLASVGAAAAFALVIPAMGQEGTKPVAPAPVKTPAPAKDAGQPGKAATATQATAPQKPGFVPGAQLPEAIKLEKNQHDWGVISDQKPVDYDFNVTNVSEETIKITISASCGCTVPVVEKNVLAPGESTKAQARFNPKGRSGTQTKTVTITVNEPAQKYASQSIVLTSTVKALVTVEPAKVHMQEVDHRKGSSQKVIVTGRKEGFAVIGVESNNPDIKTKVGEPQLVEENGEKLTKVEVEVEAGKGANIGELVGQLTVKTNDERVDPVMLMVAAQVVGTARANPANLFLRVGTPSTPFTTQVRIDSRNGTPFKVRSIEVDSRDDMSLATDIEVQEGGKYSILTLSGVTPATAGYVQGTVIVETDADGGETLRVPFSASIRNPSPVGKPAAAAPAVKGAPNAAPAVKAAPSATPALKPSTSSVAPKKP